MRKILIIISDPEIQKNNFSQNLTYLFFSVIVIILDQARGFS